MCHPLSCDLHSCSWQSNYYAHFRDGETEVQGTPSYQVSGLASDAGSLALPTPAFASKQGKELLAVSSCLSPGGAPRTLKTSIRGTVDLLLYILEQPFPGGPPNLLSTLVATINVSPHPSVTCRTRNMEASLSGRFQGVEFPRKCLVERLAGQLARGRSRFQHPLRSRCPWCEDSEGSSKNGRSRAVRAHVCRALVDAEHFPCVVSFLTVILAYNYLIPPFRRRTQRSEKLGNLLEDAQPVRP